MTETDLGKAAYLAQKIIQVSQTALLLNLRFMDTAIFRLTPVYADTTLATDGLCIYHGADYVLRRYKEEQTQVTRDLLHMVMHCIFRHPFVNSLVDQPVWNLAVDIAVENTINSLNIDCVDSKRVIEQANVISSLEKKLKLMSAEHIYSYFKSSNITDAELLRLSVLFASDDHSIWYKREKPQQSNADGQGDDNSDNGDNSGDNNSDDNNPNDNNSNEGGSSRSELENEWEDVSRHIQMDLESFSKAHGTQAGGMVAQLRELNREKYDYSAFLKKFAVMGEAMKINDDEFDYIFYTYGLQLYGNVPLIEPLEYKEVKRIREFVIAIDTSGSTSGTLVQRFLEKTYSILKNTESFFSKINLHIIQCDADIQEHVKITKQEEFDEYISHFKVKGMGGTDFRPVFSEVDRMIRDHEFTHLKGLIYFTDGYGTFPAKKPDYETAFVFMRSEYDNPDVPAWAIKLVLDEKEI